MSDKRNNTRMASSSKVRATSVANTAIEYKIYGEMIIMEIKTEKKARITEKTRLNVECYNSGKRVPEENGFWENKKEKENDIKNLLVGSTFC